MNKLLISEDSIKFLGFELLNRHITFCLYPGGIIIQPNWREEKWPHCYECILDDERKISDKTLIAILKNRGIFDEDLFVCANNQHYIELTPHAKRLKK